MSERTGTGLSETLERRLHLAVRLVVTDNARVMVSWRRVAGLLLLRLHRVFLEAPPEVAETLSAFILRPTTAGRRALLRFISGLVPPRAAAPARAARPRRGRHFDLAEVFERLNAEYFGGEVKAEIAWARRGPRRACRSIRLGSYHGGRNVIRIHPRLDSDRVPAYVLESIVYHEMLHAVLGVVTGGNGRRIVHGAEFRRRLKWFAHHSRAEMWRRRNIETLLRAPDTARRGSSWRR